MRAQIESLVREMVSKGVVYEDAVREFESRFIQCALEAAKGNIGRAAEKMGIHRNTFSRKMDEHGIRKG